MKINTLMLAKTFICHGSAMVNKSYSIIIEYTKTTDV